MSVVDTTTAPTPPPKIESRKMAATNNRHPQMVLSRTARQRVALRSDSLTTTFERSRTTRTQCRPRSSNLMTFFASFCSCSVPEVDSTASRERQVSESVLKCRKRDFGY